MSELWHQNIRTCRNIVEQNLGPRMASIVSGSQGDQAYWQDKLEKTRRDVFRADGGTSILSSLEQTRKGNFLGSINAWKELLKTVNHNDLPPMVLMNMVFGLGKRLSPFTQALVNRKPAFPTPMRSRDGEQYLTTADVASFSANLWLNHLEENGFRGIIIKWGDEAVIPGRNWSHAAADYREVDGMRFVWLTEPTEDLAREKEWVEYDPQSNRMTFQYTRQGLESLHRRRSEHGRNRLVGVNLGSLGISYRLMDAAAQVFEQDILDETRWVDWDPYTWIALSCQDELEWRTEAALEEQAGKTGIRELEKRVPDFYSKISQVRELFHQQHGRYPVIEVLDFGQPYWMDWGLHLSLRHSLEALISDSDLGSASRELFKLPQERDGRGNFVLRSELSQGADIRNSMLVDSMITDPKTVIHGGLVVAGRHRKLSMPHGGSLLFCAAEDMRLDGPGAIAFRATGKEFQLQEGDRLAQLYLSHATLSMRTNESMVNYEGENYTLPVMGNPMSFEEASRRMSLEDTRLVEKRWLDQWSSWGSRLELR